jgi:hypothetical protein
MSSHLQLFLEVLDKGTATGTTGTRDAANPACTNRGKAVLPDLLLCCICWVLGEYGTLADKLPSPHKVTTGQVIPLHQCQHYGTVSYPGTILRNLQPWTLAARPHFTGIGLLDRKAYCVMRMITSIAFHTGLLHCCTA